MWASLRINFKFGCRGGFHIRPNERQFYFSCIVNKRTASQVMQSFRYLPAEMLASPGVGADNDGYIAPLQGIHRVTAIFGDGDGGKFLNFLGGDDFFVEIIASPAIHRICDFLRGIVVHLFLNPILAKQHTFSLQFMVLLQLCCLTKGIYKVNAYIYYNRMLCESQIYVNTHFHKNFHKYLIFPKICSKM